MLMRAPRTRLISSSGSASRSLSAKVIVPVVRACGGSSRMMASDVADLPDPDSPTKPSVPDSGMEKLTSRTAATSPVCVAKLTFRCSTWRSEGTILHEFDGTGARTYAESPLRAHLICRDSRLNAFVHRCHKCTLFFQQRAGRGGEFAFQIQQALCGKLLRQFNHLFPREIYILAIVRMRHAHRRAFA